MHVLQVSKYYYPSVGGIEQVVRTLAEGFDGDGHAVTVLATAEAGRGGRETVHGVDVRRTTTLGELMSVPVSPTYPAAMARAGRDADLVHLHLPNPLAVVSYLAAGNDGSPLVVTYHSDIVRQSAALRLYRPLLDRVLDRADRVVTTSPRLLAHSDYLAPHRENCTVVPLSVDPGEHGPYEGPAFDLPTDPGRPTLLFVGRLSYYKGVEHLVDAMVDVEADLLVAGDGERRAALERRARERGVEGKVSFLGHVPDRKLRYCYDAADLFVLPSVEPSEAFGVVQLEAMAHGVPVVNTDLPTGVPWVSPDGETGLTVPPADSGALADAIGELLADPDRRRRYGENARERVERQFTHDRMLDGVAAVYDDVLP